VSEANFVFTDHSFPLILNWRYTAHDINYRFIGFLDAAITGLKVVGLLNISEVKKKTGDSIL
jgi:hypothetical protein